MGRHSHEHCVSPCIKRGLERRFDAGSFRDLERLESPIALTGRFLGKVPRTGAQLIPHYSQRPVTGNELPKKLEPLAIELGQLTVEASKVSPRARKGLNEALAQRNPRRATSQSEWYW